MRYFYQNNPINISVFLLHQLVLFLMNFLFSLNAENLLETNTFESVHLTFDWLPADGGDQEGTNQTLI